MRTQKELKGRLTKVEADERLYYPPATYQINGPLALIQVGLKTEANLLRWVLDMPYRKYHGEDKGESHG